ncbi:MAG: hypothetical protein ABJD07_07310 [Gemmatimonadaceae bacterium]
MIRTLTFRSLLRRTTPVVAGLALLTACASASTDTGAAAGTSGSRYLVTATDLSTTSGDNLFEAIYKLRPDFLRGSGGTSYSQGTPSEGRIPVIAYRDGVRLAAIDDLRQIPVQSVAQVKYIPGPQAGVKYGTNHAGGVIEITSK